MRWRWRTVHDGPADRPRRTVHEGPAGRPRPAVQRSKSSSTASVAGWDWQASTYPA